MGYAISLLVGSSMVSYLIDCLPVWLRSFLLICTIVVVAIFVAFFVMLLYGADREEKRIRNYLAECEGKYKKGEMTKEEYDEIIFHYCYDFNG